MHNTYSHSGCTFYSPSSCYWPTNSWCHHQKGGCFPSVGQKGNVWKMVDQCFTQTHTLQTTFRVCCVYTDKMSVKLLRDSGCHSTSSWLYVNYEIWRGSSVNISRQIQMPKLDQTIKMINCGVRANASTHVSPDCHTHTHTHKNK